MFDGISARSKGEYSAINLNSRDNSEEAEMTHHITMKNCSAFGSGNQLNVVSWSVGRTRDSLIEDSWSYGFGRKSIQLYGAVRMTIRRFVARYDYWDGGSYKPNDPRIGFAIYNSKDGIYENIISLDDAPDPPARASASKAGFAIEGNLTSTTAILGASGNQWLGILALNNDGTGLYTSSVPTGPNDNNQIRDFAFWGNRYGLVLHANSSNNLYTSGTLGGSAQMGARANNTSVTNIREPAYSPTLRYLVRPTMVAGHERGGTIVNRYENGTITNVPLWPWPNEELIRSQMCNPTDLTATHRVASGGPGWEPAWCASGKSLSDYIWGYMGHTVPPLNLAASPADASITLTWSPNTANTDISGYKVYLGTSSGIYNHAGYVGGKAVGLATSETISGLTPGTPYYLTVTAVDRTKGESGYSYEIVASPNRGL